MDGVVCSGPTHRCSRSPHLSRSCTHERRTKTTNNLFQVSTYSRLVFRCGLNPSIAPALVENTYQDAVGLWSLVGCSCPSRAPQSRCRLHARKRSHGARQAVAVRRAKGWLQIHQLCVGLQTVYPRHQLSRAYCIRSRVGVMAAYPFIGSRVSLISKSDMRYEGTLYTIDPQNSTIALSSGRQLLSCSMPSYHPCQSSVSGLKIDARNSRLLLTPPFSSLPSCVCFPRSLPQRLHL